MEWTLKPVFTRRHSFHWKDEITPSPEWEGIFRGALSFYGVLPKLQNCPNDGHKLTSAEVPNRTIWATDFRVFPASQEKTHTGNRHYSPGSSIKNKRMSGTEAFNVLPNCAFPFVNCQAQAQTNFQVSSPSNFFRNFSTRIGRQGIVHEIIYHKYANAYAYLWGAQSG